MNLPEPPRDNDPVSDVEPYVFPHPQWTVGVVLVIALVMLLLGTLAHPVWFLIGSPFILTLFVWLAVRITQRRRRPETHDSADAEAYTNDVGRNHDRDVS